MAALSGILHGSRLILPPPVAPLTCVRASSQGPRRKEQKLQVTNWVVSATTELLRLFSLANPNRESISTSDLTSDMPAPETGFTQMQDVMDALKVDYNQAYFLTGKFTRSLYADDCYFADPTISFTGTDLYERNLKLLMPFLEESSLSLFSLNKESVEDRSIRAAWKLRTRLKLPWRPIICVAGSTDYILNEQMKVVSHVESWNVSALEALAQIFSKGNVPS